MMFIKSKPRPYFIEIYVKPRLSSSYSTYTNMYPFMLFIDCVPNMNNVSLFFIIYRIARVPASFYYRKLRYGCVDLLNRVYFSSGSVARPDFFTRPAKTKIYVFYFMYKQGLMQMSFIPGNCLLNYFCFPVYLSNFSKRTILKIFCGLS